MIDVDMSVSPVAYARRLASYIKDPSTIRARTLGEFGRAPSVDEIKRLIGGYEPKQPERKPFRCGHSREEGNIYYSEVGTEFCLICRRAMEAKAAKDHRERMERAEVGLPKLDVVQPKKLPPIPKSAKLTSGVLDRVAKAFNMTRGELCGESRRIRYVCARAVASKLLIERGMSYPKAASALNRTCHSSIINLMDKWPSYCSRFPEVKAIYEALR